jgi:hypothetical protein
VAVLAAVLSSAVLEYDKKLAHCIQFQNQQSSLGIVFYTRQVQFPPTIWPLSSETKYGDGEKMEV